MSPTVPFSPDNKAVLFFNDISVIENFGTLKFFRFCKQRQSELPFCNYDRAPGGKSSLANKKNYVIWYLTDLSLSIYPMVSYSCVAYSVFLYVFSVPECAANILD